MLSRSLRLKPQFREDHVIAEYSLPIVEGEVVVLLVADIIARKGPGLSREFGLPCECDHLVKETSYATS